MKIEDVRLPAFPAEFLPLETIWAHRLDLMGEYHKKGKLPPWPISVEDEQGQIFMRDLMGFLEEEIFEAFEILEKSEHILRRGDLDHDQRIAHFLEFNEEVADTLHLWFEVMIYFNISGFDIGEYYRKLLKEKQILPIAEVDSYKDILELAIRYGYFVLNNNHGIQNTSLLLGNIDLISTSVLYSIDDYPYPKELFMGGRYLSAKVVRLSQEYIFQSVKYLQNARHTLKIKYWRNQNDRPNYEALHNSLMEAWLYYVCFLCLNNYQTSNQYQNIYLRKHFINLDRISKEW